MVFGMSCFYVVCSGQWSALSVEMVICRMTSDIKKCWGKMGSPQQFSGIVPPAHQSEGVSF